jgi:Pvc16 N-terminal domain
MFQDLDKTLEELLKQKLPRYDETQTDIKFELPNQDWESKLQKSVTINFFLYDIRENLELRSNERFLTRNGATGTETIAPVRMDLSYMVTVWTKEIADEHRLLGSILKTLLCYPTLPTEVLQGEMNQSLPLRAWVTQPEKTPNTWDFWSSLDGRVKAGLSYMVTVPVQPFAPVEVPLVTEKVIKLEHDERGFSE